MISVCYGKSKGDGYELILVTLRVRAFCPANASKDVIYWS